MQKNSNDYDDVFETMKQRHARLFLGIINACFGTAYTEDDIAVPLPTDGSLHLRGRDGTKIERRFSDFLMEVDGVTYLLECQSYEDGSMAVRIAEYAFLSARQGRTVGPDGRIRLRMPRYAVIYVKSSSAAPRRTLVTFEFPDGKSVDYDADNIFIGEVTKEEIFEKGLYPYIPFYIARYERDLAGGKGLPQAAVDDLAFLREGMEAACRQGKISQQEMLDIRDYVNIIIRHITNGNSLEERMVDVMANIIVTKWDREIDAAVEKGLEQGLEKGLEKGRDVGVEQANRLNRWLIGAGRLDDLHRSVEDQLFQKELFREMEDSAAVG